MNKYKYNTIIKELTEHRKGVSDSKREDYTKGSEDVLDNFKSVARATGVSPLQVWLVYSSKHWDAICNYVKSDGQSESEPIQERFGDLLNYLELGWALISEGTELHLEQNDSHTFTFQTEKKWINEEEADYVRDNLVKDTQYKEGDVVEIIANNGNHNFDIGETVELIEQHNFLWVGKNELGYTWHLNETEFKPATSTNRSAGI